jgi:predicted Zn-ribbon and HTH transcriptional regulator
MHLTHVVVLRREGTRLKPALFMVDECMDCGIEFDRKRVTRAFGDVGRGVSK